MTQDHCEHVTLSLYYFILVSYKLLMKQYKLTTILCLIRYRLETWVNPYFKKYNFFLLKINFLYILDRFDTLISKIIFKK
jgi:hypothetical protein